MQLESSEYQAHLAECSACRHPDYRHVTQAQHRPHTMDVRCWCIGNKLPKLCELDIPAFRDLPEVEYV